MGIVQKDALVTSIISYFGLFLGYLNKGVLFVALLSTDEIGIANLILAVSLLFAQFANFGTFNAIWRFFPNLKNESNSHNGFLAFNLKIAIVGTIVVSILLFIFNQQIADYYSRNSQDFVDYFVWIVPTGIAILLFKLLDGYARALYKSVYAVFLNDLLLRLLITIILVLFFYDLFDFKMLISLLCIAQWIPGLLLIFYLIKLGEWKVSPKRIRIHKKMRKIIYNYSGYSYLNSMGSSIVLTIDALMVAGMLGLAETGVYTTMIYFSRALTIPYNAIIRVAAPLVSNLWKENALKRMGELYSMVSSVSLTIGLLLFAGVWVSRFELFAILPSDFEIGIYTFLFIMIGSLIDMYCGLNAVILITSKKYRYDLIFTGILMIIVVLLNLWLIPIYGIVGAAISTSAAYLMYNLFRLTFVWWKFKLHPFSKSNVYIIVLFTLIMSLFELTNIQFPNLFLTIVFNSVVFTALFIGTIYYFKLEPNIVGYINKVLIKLKISKG